MRKLFIPAVCALALAAFTTSGCGNKPATPEASAEVKTDQSFNDVKIMNLYSMSIPDYLTIDSTLNNEASLQYSNPTKEVYVIVIDELKQEFIDIFKGLGEYDEAQSACDNYAEAQMAYIEESMDTVTSKLKFRTANLGGCDARIADGTGTHAGITDPMGFTVAFVEGKENLYMIMTWTFDKWKSEYQEDMDKMINSFKEL